MTRATWRRARRTPRPAMCPPVSSTVLPSPRECAALLVDADTDAPLAALWMCAAVLNTTPPAAVVHAWPEHRAAGFVTLVMDFADPVVASRWLSRAREAYVFAYTGGRGLLAHGGLRVEVEFRIPGTYRPDALTGASTVVVTPAAGGRS